MKKIFILSFFILYYSFTGSAQCDPPIQQNIINTACSTLVNMMDCHLKKKKYDKALAVYIIYKHVNEDFSVPQNVKSYFTNLSEDDLKKLARVRLTLRGSSTGTGSTSSMPTIIVSSH